MLRHLARIGIHLGDVNNGLSFVAALAKHMETVRSQKTPVEEVPRTIFHLRPAQLCCIYNQYNTERLVPRRLSMKMITKPKIRGSSELVWVGVRPCPRAMSPPPMLF